MRRAIIIAASAIVLLTGGVVEYRRLYPPVPLLQTLKDGLVSYWTMENPASQGEPDRCGSNDLTVQGTIGSVPGKIGNARSQRGSGVAVNYLQAPADPSMQFPNLGQAFTWTAWVRAVGINPDSGVRVGVLGRNGGAVMEYGIEVAASVFRFHIIGGNTTATIVVNFAPSSIGNWHLVIAWRSEDGALRIRVDNGVTTTQPSTSPIALAGAAFRIFNQGGSAAMNTDFDGDIDEVGLWNRVLTTDEQAALWNSGNGLAYSNFDCHGTPPPPPGKHGGIIGGGVF